ncbi:MAG: IS30 family transposase [Alcanivoracaceae bacterium]
MSYHHITENERYQIYAWKKAGWTQKDIATKLKRHPSTVSRELRRNSGQRGYRPRQAQGLAQERQGRSASNARCIPASHWLRIEAHLREDWSPEQIAGRTGLGSHESIYLHVYRDKAGGGDLHQHLRCRKKRRKRYGSGRDRRGQIKGRVPISERPKAVDAKQRLGDWEGDTVIGANHRGALVTLVERRSQLARIRRVDSRDAQLVSAAVIRALTPVSRCCRTLTFDNGKEFAGHATIRDKVGTKVYFADPYASWQRGLNEQVNGLIRQYLPKGSSFATLDDKEIAMIEKKLNNRPRKMLGYQTPLEVFNRMAASKGVALRY